jgi:Fur family transcriptional regulator, ferric uptake regulator
VDKKRFKTEDILKREGFRKTKARSVVFDFMRDSDRPMTYDEVYLALTDKNISVNISTVYRILEAFTDKGIVTKINGGEGNRSLYELTRNEHRHYFYCVCCKELFPIKICPLSLLVGDLESTMEYKVIDHKFELSGICCKCKA